VAAGHQELKKQQKKKTAGGRLPQQMLALKE
jgi:hypothetical protein